MARRVATLLFMTALLFPARAGASDPVLDWIAVMNDAVLTGGTNGIYTSRNVGLVGAAIFDAVNGIEKRYDPLVVGKYTGPHASSRAAAVQAAYAMLLKLYSAQSDTLNNHRTSSLAEISSGPGADKDKEIAAGIAYGQFVADTIYMIRSKDGFAPDPPPPFAGIDRVGFWRPTATNAFAVGPQFATMTPWVLIRASQFRLPPPPALGSPAYIADYNETKATGRGPAPTPPTPLNAMQTVARFWAGNTALFWNRIASQVASSRNLSLVETAHLFGMLNVAMADAGIACWDGKFRYVFWRPVTAIQLSGPDGTPTGADPTWTPFLGVTPAHPEYPSGHSTVSGAASHLLATVFGDDTSFTVGSETLPGTIKSFASFSDALADIHNARVWGGIHFRTACRLGSELGVQVADWVMANAMKEHGDH
jgi:hypothetical protein